MERLVTDLFLSHLECHRAAQMMSFVISYESCTLLLDLIHCVNSISKQTGVGKQTRLTACMLRAYILSWRAEIVQLSAMLLSIPDYLWRILPFLPDTIIASTICHRCMILIRHDIKCRAQNRNPFSYPNSLCKLEKACYDESLFCIIYILKCSCMFCVLHCSVWLQTIADIFAWETRWGYLLFGSERSGYIFLS